MAAITIISAILAAAGAIVPAALQYDAQAQALDAAADMANSAPNLESTGPAWTPSPMGQYVAAGNPLAGPPTGGGADYSNWIAPAIGAAGIGALYMLVKK